jgi:hypothetical protein
VRPFCTTFDGIEDRGHGFVKAQWKFLHLLDPPSISSSSTLRIRITRSLKKIFTGNGRQGEADFVREKISKDLGKETVLQILPLRESRRFMSSVILVPLLKGLRVHLVDSGGITSLDSDNRACQQCFEAFDNVVIDKFAVDFVEGTEEAQSEKFPPSKMLEELSNIAFGTGLGYVVHNANLFLEINNESSVLAKENVKEVPNR